MFGKIIEEKNNRFKFLEFYPTGSLGKLHCFKMKAVKLSSFEEMTKELARLNSQPRIQKDVRFYMERDEDPLDKNLNSEELEKKEIKEILSLQENLDALERLYLVIRIRHIKTSDMEIQTEDYRYWVILQNDIYMNKTGDELNFEIPKLLRTF